MNNEIILSYEIFETAQKLPRSISNLLKKAEEARDNAYAPYSKFSVGCALLLDNGEIITGNNQENAAYPSGLCAERVAIFSAFANYPNAVVEALVITTSSKNPSAAVSPCGACRQVLIEYENKQRKEMSIFFQGANESFIKTKSAKDLLPFAFNANMLP